MYCECFYASHSVGFARSFLKHFAARSNNITVILGEKKTSNLLNHQSEVTVSGRGNIPDLTQLVIIVFSALAHIKGDGQNMIDGKITKLFGYSRFTFQLSCFLSPRDCADFKNFLVMPLNKNPAILQESPHEFGVVFFGCSTQDATHHQDSYIFCRGSLVTLSFICGPAAFGTTRIQKDDHP